MALRDVFKRARERFRGSKVARGGRAAGGVVKSVLDSLKDETLEKAFRAARAEQAPSTDEIPADFQLRQSSWPRRVYERVRPVSHVFRITSKYEREHLDDFMPLSPDAYIGRGSYKFVYRLPWKMVLKVSKEILQSDPLFGSLYREVDAHQERFLEPEELELFEYLTAKGRGLNRERLRFKFNRLALERFSYWKVREALPDLVIPTKFFMGVRYRRNAIRFGHSEKITPMDSQVLLVGKHLKEFATAGQEMPRGRFLRKFSQQFEFVFDSGRFGKIKKKVLVKIAEDFQRLIRFTEFLAYREKLILDIHTENIIITLPDFQLKVFDFHLFDEHLYEPSLKYDRPEKDHIEVIEKFVESFHLDE